MATQILAWQCDYCGAVKKSKKIILRHEAACINNPDSQNCINCLHKNGTTCKKKPGVMCSRAVSARCPHYQYDDKSRYFIKPEGK